MQPFAITLFWTISFCAASHLYIQTHAYDLALAWYLLIEREIECECGHSNFALSSTNVCHCEHTQSLALTWGTDIDLLRKHVSRILVL